MFDFSLEPEYKSQPLQAIFGRSGNILLYGRTKVGKTIISRAIALLLSKENLKFDQILFVHEPNITTDDLVFDSALAVLSGRPVIAIVPTGRVGGLLREIKTILNTAPVLPIIDSITGLASLQLKYASSSERENVKALLSKFNSLQIELGMTLESNRQLNLLPWIATAHQMSTINNPYNPLVSDIHYKPRYASEILHYVHRLVHVDYTPTKRKTQRLITIVEDRFRVEEVGRQYLLRFTTEKLDNVRIFYRRRVGKSFVKYELLPEKTENELKETVITARLPVIRKIEPYKKSKDENENENKEENGSSEEEE